MSRMSEEGIFAGLSGKVAFVTGGAAGIGRAAVERLAEAGVNVVVGDIDDPAPFAQSLPGEIVNVPCDVRREPDIVAAIAVAERRFGGLDLVFNNAGGGRAVDGIERTSVEDWNQAMSLMLTSVMLGIKHAAPALRRRGGGSIVNTASTAAMQAGLSAAYSTAKAGVIHLTRLAAAELARDGIRVNSISPGLIVTSIFAKGAGLEGEQARRLDDQIAAAAPFAQPLRRAGHPDDVADACLFLFSEGARFITGTNLIVDGGATVGPRSSWDEGASSSFEDMQVAAQRHQTIS